MLPTIVCFGSASICTPANTGTSQTVILGVYTPASLPLGYNFGTASIRTSATRTVLAFLPFGFLAFCVRRRRRLSKALWVLVTVVAVTAGVSGCGGNLTDFFTPIPTGPQTVTVTASSAAAGVSRSFVVPIAIN